MKILSFTKTISNNSIELLACDSFEKKNSVSPILIVGVVHGDEPQGFHIINEFLKTQKNECENLLFIPCLNPDGMQKNTRTNANNVDINRNFPTKNWGHNEGENATCDDCNSAYFGGKSPASEIETKFLIDTVNEFTPKLVITLHSPYKVVNYDGNAQEVAELISEIIHYPVEASIGYPTPGSFGTYCAIENNIPVITLELDENCPVENLYKPMFQIFETLNAI